MKTQTLQDNSRKTECAAIGSWAGLGVRTPFALLDSHAQRSLTRPAGPDFLTVERAEPALCGLIRTSHNPPDDVAHAPTRAVSRLFSTLRRAATQRSEPERRQEWRRGTQSACATSLPKKSGEKCGLSAHVRNYDHVYRCVGRTARPAGDALVPPEPARGPAAVQGDRPTLLSSASDSLAYLRNSSAQPSLTRPAGPEFLTARKAEPALCPLPSNSPAQRSIKRAGRSLREFLAVGRAEALCGLAILSFFAAGSLHAAAVAADSARGTELFATLSCIQCHSVNGKGGTVAPDLGVRIDRDFTPATLAATMWNHAPAMWASMRQRNIRAGDLDEQGAADLFAYFYSARFFEKPGDAGRGKRLFSANHCAECHGLTETKTPEAKPVSQWESIGQPMALVNAMWNHAATMRQEFAEKKAALAGADIAGPYRYPGLSARPSRRAQRGCALEISSGANGQALFESKGCAACHTGKNALSSRLKGETLTDIAAAMWNHEPRMPAAPAPLDLGEMREIVSYLWAEQFFEDAGNPPPARAYSTAKRCAVCHNDPSSGAPKLAGPGPRVLLHRRRDGRGAVASWPQHARPDESQGHRLAALRRPGMANLIAYLNAQNGGKVESDMADHQKQPVIVLLTSHWIAMAGVALVTLAGFSWLFVLPENIRGNVGNPYIGLLVFIAIPAVFFAGLALIPIGIALGRRKAAAGFGGALDRRAAWRRAGIFFAVMTHGEPGHRKPANLSRRRAHGNRPVLRTELPCHAARVHRPSPPAAPGGELRLLPYRARGGQAGSRRR